MANLRLSNVTKRFPDGTTAVAGIDVEIQDREFLVLVGPSGCGKSTTLRMIAGLETATLGDIEIGDRRVNDVAPKDRDIAMVFQNYALYPHMTVYKNMSFGLHLRYGGNWLARMIRRLLQPQRAAELNERRAGIDSRVRETAARLDIEPLLDRKPHQLSGGERQRVALGRAIVRNPAVFLFDEPLSNLDAKLRQQMRVELKRLHRELQTTMIYVTHDQVEAMTLGDRVAVMDQGKLQQIGPPLEIYQHPANLFVARFFGAIPINLWQGTVKRKGNTVTTETPQPFSMERELDPATDILNDKETFEVILGIRPEDVWPTDDLAQAEITGTVISVDQLGESKVIHVQTESPSSANRFLNEGRLFAKADREFQCEIGQPVGLRINPQRISWFDPETGENFWKDNS